MPLNILPKRDLGNSLEGGKQHPESFPLSILILAMISAENYATEFDNTVVVFLLFTISTVLNLVYVIGGPRLVTERSAPNEE